MKDKTFVHASLFSGIGGPEVAAEMLGWQNAFHCEIQPFPRKVLNYWFPNSKCYEDITKSDFREWRGKIDVLTGGFPCQPFSYADICNEYSQREIQRGEDAEPRRICQDPSLLPHARWKNFPQIEPTIRGGDDGFSFGVDVETISESKWRQETLKAYGNAIVPQVMYEIFRAIEETEKAYE